MKKLKTILMPALMLAALAVSALPAPARAQGVSAYTADIGRTGEGSSWESYDNIVPTFADVLGAGTHGGTGQTLDEFVKFCEAQKKALELLRTKVQQAANKSGHSAAFRKKGLNLVKEASKTSGAYDTASRWAGKAAKVLKIIDFVSTASKAAAYMSEGDRIGAMGVVVDDLAKKGTAAAGAFALSWIPWVGPVAGATAAEEFHKKYTTPVIDKYFDDIRVADAKKKKLGPDIPGKKVMYENGSVRTLPPDMYVEKKTGMIRRRTRGEQQAYEKKYREDSKAAANSTHVLHQAERDLRDHKITDKEFDKIVDTYNNPDKYKYKDKEGGGRRKGRNTGPTIPTRDSDEDENMDGQDDGQAQVAQDEQLSEEMMGTPGREMSAEKTAQNLAGGPEPIAFVKQIDGNGKVEKSFGPQELLDLEAKGKLTVGALADAGVLPNRFWLLRRNIQTNHPNKLDISPWTAETIAAKIVESEKILQASEAALALSGMGGIPISQMPREVREGLEANQAALKDLRGYIKEFKALKAFMESKPYLKWNAIEQGASFMAGESVRTSPGTEVLITFSTGAVVRVEGDSDLTLFPRTTKKTSMSTVYARLRKGVYEFYFPRGAAGAKKFGVETKRVHVGIKGTKFGITHELSVTTITMLEGTVEATELATGKVFTLAAGQVGTFSPAGVQADKAAVSPAPDGKQADEAAWATQKRGNVTISIPSAWKAIPEMPKNQGGWFAGASTDKPDASIAVVCLNNFDHMLKDIKDMKKTPVTIGGRKATHHIGRITDGGVYNTAMMIVLDQPEADGTTIAFVAMVPSDGWSRHEPIIRKAIDSVRIDGRGAPVFGPSAMPGGETTLVTSTGRTVDRAVPLPADKPQELDSTTRAMVLLLMASESCLQKAIAAGTLAEADLGETFSEVLTTAGISAEQYDKLRAELGRKPEPTDAAVLQAFVEEMCPAEDAPAAETGEAYWVRACMYKADMMEAQMGGDLSPKEMDKVKIRISRKCLDELKTVHPDIADKVAACILATTYVDDLDACESWKTRGARAGTVTARSFPSGVEVYLDGSHIGTTPVTLRDVSADWHVLEWRVNNHPACTYSIQVTGNTEQTFDCGVPRFIYRARLSDRDHHNSKWVRLKSADGVIRQDRAWVHRYNKLDAEDELDPLFDSFDGRASMEGLLSGSLSTEDKRRILNTEPLIEVWIWDHRLDVRFID